MREVRRAAAFALGTVLLVTGCSGGEGGGDADPSPESSSPTAPAVETAVKVAQVAGSLTAGRRDGVERGVRAAVDAWIDAAYLGDFPRDGAGEGAFATFTDGAAQLARRDERLLSNAAVAPRVDSVTATRRLLYLDVLAPGGRPAGVTARVRVVMDLAGGVERTDVVRGRLTLIPADDGWRVFGWDLRRETAS